MKSRTEYDGLLKSLSENAKTLELDGLTVEVRDCADRQPGRADPRSAAAARLTWAEFTARRAELDPELWANEDHLFGPADPQGYSPLELLRFQFGWTSSDLSTGVRTLHRQVPGPRGPVSVYQYEVLSACADRPCMVFFHGGGFFGGVIPTVENQCKLLAQLSGGVVLSVEYPLCPEHKFPEGFDACYAAVEWVWAHAQELGVSREKLGVCGDSAGGNLSLACSLRDRDEGKGMISYQALIYPTVSRLEKVGAAHYWKPELYENPDRDPLIDEQIRVIGSMGSECNGWYTAPGEDLQNPYLSPLFGDPAGLPKTLLMTAEYDFLRAECEEYSRRLCAAGVENRHIRYGGIFHGTFDRLGYAPQVEDMLREIAADMKAL